MSTHNICFCGEIRKIITIYPLLSRPMHPAMQNTSDCVFVHYVIGPDKATISLVTKTC